jgi:hypothetical protein
MVVGAARTDPDGRRRMDANFASSIYTLCSHFVLDMDYVLYKAPSTNGYGTAT